MQAALQILQDTTSLAADVTVPVPETASYKEKLVANLPTIIAFVLVAALFIKIWKILMAHPVIFAIAVIGVLVSVGAISITGQQ